MISPTQPGRRSRRLLAGCAAVFAVAALAAAPQPAAARVWVSVGGPFPGYYPVPGPCCGYYPPPYYYGAPQNYYPPAGDPAAAYPAPGYGPPAGPAPSAYSPSVAPTMQPAPLAPSTAVKPGITYTNKPAFTNSAGQTCREYKVTSTGGGHPVDVYGTACKQGDGQWRVVN
jgi:hypothetical protein